MNLRSVLLLGLLALDDSIGTYVGENWLAGAWIGHSGGFSGPNTVVRYYPATEWTVVALSNDSQGVRELVDQVEWLLGRTLP